jgi:hypothetical protein
MYNDDVGVPLIFLSTFSVDFMILSASIRWYDYKLKQINPEG